VSTELPAEWVQVRMLRRLVNVALATAVLAGAGRSEDARACAERVTVGVRNAHGLFYDDPAGRVVLYGGADASGVKGDTWAWNRASRRWDLVTTAGPAARTFPAVAFDRDRGEAVLFGGNRVLFGSGNETDSYLDDTWVWRHAAWVRVTAVGPGPRAEAAMAYDPIRRRCVLFGGYRRTSAGTERFADTWEWDGERWQRVALKGPTARNGTALAYDERLRRVVLSGGPPAFVSPATWAWDGRAWMELPGPVPPARFNPAMVFHSRLEALVRFGGWTGQSRAGDTWKRDANGWTRMNVAGPSPRNHAAMAYDRRRGIAVLFGGHDGELVFGDTWEFDGRRWSRIASVHPQRREENGH
jgi:hypothetical protein